MNVKDAYRKLVGIIQGYVEEENAVIYDDHSTFVHGFGYEYSVGNVKMSNFIVANNLGISIRKDKLIIYFVGEDIDTGLKVKEDIIIKSKDNKILVKGENLSVVITV